MANQPNGGVDKARDPRIRSFKDRPNHGRTVSLPAVNSISTAKPNFSTSTSSSASFLADDWSYLPNAGFVDLWANVVEGNASFGAGSDTAPTFEQLIAWTPAKETDSIEEEPMDTSSDDVEESSSQQRSTWPSFDSLTSMEPAPHTQVAPIAPMVPRQPSTKHSPRDKSRNCLQRILQASLVLHSFDKPCNTTRASPPSKSQALNIDEVLLRNREMVRLLDSTLRCRCVADQDVLLACCLALTEIVSWYGAAMDTSSTGRVVSAPILMGSYCLDATAQRSVLARVVLSELQEQIHPLLAKFPGHSVVGFSASPAAFQAMEGQKCAIREQIRSVVLKANSLIRS